MALAPRASSRCSRSRRYPAARPWASRRRTSIPHATFAAYRTHDGLAIARAEGGAAGTVDAAGWSGLAAADRVEVGGEVIGELRVPSTAQLEIRAPGGHRAGRDRTAGTTAPRHPADDWGRAADAQLPDGRDHLRAEPDHSQRADQPRPPGDVPLRPARCRRSRRRLAPGPGVGAVRAARVRGGVPAG